MKAVDLIIGYLTEIEALLFQIENITQNQNTLLLQSSHTDEEEHLNCLEQMVEVKDEVMNRLIEVEALFGESYEKHRQELISSPYMKEIKQRVERLLAIKERITQQEQNNVLLVKRRSAWQPEPTSIKPNAAQVTRAYKQSQIRN